MSTSEILSELHRLTAAERETIRVRLDDIEAASPLSSEEKALVDKRVSAYRQNPDYLQAWTVAEAEIRKELVLNCGNKRHSVGRL